MGALEPAAVLAQYGTQIQRTLVHPAPRAKELVLREVFISSLFLCNWFKMVHNFFFL